MSGYLDRKNIKWKKAWKIDALQQTFPWKIENFENCGLNED